MADSEDVFDIDRIGVWSEPTEFVVERERTIAYAAATNDPIKQHVEGIYAPPVFAVVPPFTQMAQVTMQAVPDHLMLRIVHGEQEMVLHRPIVGGDVLSSRGQVIGVHGKSSGVVVTSRIETRDAAGELVNTQLFSGFFRGGNWPHEAGEPFPAHELADSVRARTPDYVGTQTYDADQTWRYADASGDPMPIHTDEEFAKAMGFGGIIVHGLCTMAFTSQAVIAHGCPDDPERLKRIAVRFSAVGRPGQTLTTNVWDTGRSADGRDVFAFEAASNEGTVLIKDGVAEIAN